MRKNRFLFELYQAYKVLFFYPFLAITTAVLGTIATLLAIVIHPKVASICGIIWSRLNSYFTPMLVTVEGKQNIDKNQSYIIVANHQSQYDIFILYGWLPMDFKWVMKIQLRQVPFLGYSCYKIGHVFIDRSNSEAAVASINAAKQRIKNGTSIMFFPEGHRSEDGNLIPFKKGAFKFALDIGLPVLPVTILGTRDILPSNTTDLFPGKAKMVFHEPIGIESYNEENIEDLMEEARKRIQKGIDDNQK